MVPVESWPARCPLPGWARLLRHGVPLQAGEKGNGANSVLLNALRLPRTWLQLAAERLRTLGPMSRDEKLMVATMAGCVLLWVSCCSY